MAVRRESVLLELKDQGFSSGMVRAAAAAGLTEKALKSLDGTTVNINQRVSESATGVDGLSRSARDADGSINQLTGRLRVLGEVAAVLAPALAPIGGVAVAGVAGLANQLGIAAIAGGVLVGSMQGLGDALGAMNKAQLEPTQKNIEKAKDALERLTPAARDFAEQAFALKPALVALRDLGAEELFPGLTESLESLEDLGPRVAGIMQAFGGVLGDIAADSSASLASERYADFFEFIRTEGPATMQALATTVGDLTSGLTELWEAFGPLNNDFSSWLMGVADSFDGWATGLSATEGFSEFIEYIRTTGPQLADTLGAIGSAVVQIVQATAPLAGPVLAGLEGAAKAIGAIADSDLGTPIFAGIAALSLLNRTLAVTASLSKTSLSSGMFAGIGTASKGVKGAAGSFKADIAAMSDRLVVFGSNADAAGKAAERMKGRLAAGAGLAGLAVAATGAADGLGLTNTASLALMGSLAGPPGVALGAAAGALLDMKAAGEGATVAIQGLDAAVQSGDPAVLTEQIKAAKAELADITDLDFGGDIFDRIGFSIADTFGGPSMDDARRKIEASEKALADLEWQEKRAGIEAKGAALEFLTATGANVDLAKWSGKSTEQIKAQADALLESKQKADETARSFIGLGESLNDGKKSLGDWIKEMASSADALNNFTRNSRTAAKRGLDDGLIASLQAAGEEGALRMRQLANGTEAEIGRANSAFRKGEQAIERYNNYKVPPKRVTADTSRAMQSFREVDTYLSNLNGKTAVTKVITAYSTTGRQVSPDGPFRPGLADGGTVPGPRPSPWRDNVLARLGGGMIALAGTEEVITNRNGEADRFRADRAAGRIPGYADGGTTGDKPGKKKITRSGGLFVADRTDALERAIEILTGTLEDQTAATERDIATRDEWASKMADVAAGTISGFNTGLFETREIAGDSPWGSGARGPRTEGGWLENLTKDISGLNERSSLQSQLAGMGLSGDALSALLSEGTNADISSLINSGGVGQYAALYSQRAALQGSVGSSAGQQAYGQQYAAAGRAAQASLAAQQQTNIHLTDMQATLEEHTALLATVGDRAGSSAATVVQNGGNKAARRRRRDRGGLA